MKKRRVQEGIIHVYIRGNARFRVFYDDEDSIIFLKKCSRFAQKHNTKVLEFAIMINHVHLLVETSCLSLFMKEFLHSYSVWYNIKYKQSNKIFRTPFSSAEKRSEKWVLHNGIYILQNPVKAGICTSADEYMWSSVSFHFPDKANNEIKSPGKYMGQILDLIKGRNLTSRLKNKQIKIECENTNYIKPTNNLLAKCISIDTSIVDSYFHDYSQFLTYTNNIPKKFGDIEVKTNTWEKTSYSELSNIMAEYIKPKSIKELSHKQIDELILHLAKNTNASLTNIASLVHEHYDHVKKLMLRISE